jgi:hypothetical protein
MSYFDDASLVMIPSGYKDQKVYSVKPIDGSGDLTFTRSNDTATRVASNGLIEKVRTNLALQSQTLDNASWDKSDATVTANTTIAPDGTLTADTITAVVIDQRINQTVTVAASTEYTFSFFAKKGTTVTPRYSVYDLSNAAFILTQVDYSALVNTSTWSRITATFTTPAGCTSISIYPINAATLGTTFIWGCQLETGVATDYIATTSAAVSVGPVANLPRLDYSGGATCPKLLLEPQRTNLYNYSEQLNQWLTSSATVTANYAVSPDGYTNADRVQFAAGGLVYVSGTGSAGENTLSVYAKATNGVSAKFRFFANGAVTFSSDQTATGQWQRFTFTFTYSAVTAGLSVATTGADDVIFYGFQHEEGAYETSYIPTLGAAVTRGAESSSSASIPSLFGGTEGSFFIEMTFDGKNPNGSIPLFLRSSINSSFNQATYLQFGASNINYNVYSGGISQFALSGGSFTNGQNIKVAFAYKANDFALYVNGVQLGTFNSGAISTSLSFIDLGSYLDLQSTFQYDGKISQAILFPTRLSNADLATLTA